MPIPVTCPQCSATLPVPDELAGRSIRCGGCQGVVTVPAKPSASSLPPAPTRPVARAIALPAPAAQKPKPIARKVTPETEDESPLPQKALARRERQAGEDANDSEMPTAPRRRPVAKRKPPSILGAGALFWFSLLVAVGGFGTILFVYSITRGAARKGDSAAEVAGPGRAQAIANAAEFPAAPAPVAVPPALRQPELVVQAAPGANFIQQQQFQGQVQARHGLQGAEPPKLNPDDVVARYRDRLQVTASSEYAQWPARHLIDGEARTSWFPENVSGTGAWVRLQFPEPIRVSRVVIVGNYDPQWPQYLVTDGIIELLNAQGKVIDTRPVRGKLQTLNNFEWKLNTPLENVRAVRFNEIMDGNDRPTAMMALSEIQVE